MADVVPTVESLVHSAQAYACAAVQAYASGQSGHRVALEAGTGLEHILKAVLRRRSPAFLLDFSQGEQRLWESMRLVLTDEALPAKVRTVGLRNALERCRKLLSFRASPDDILQLIDLRDGAVHLGESSRLSRHLVASFVTVVNECLSDLNVEEASFWQESEQIVETILASEKDEAKASVQLRIAAGREVFARRFGPLPEEADFYLRASAVEDLDSDRESIKCPACGVAGAVNTSGVPYIKDSARELSLENIGWHVVPLWFTCRFCAMELTEPAEFDLASVRLDIPPEKVLRNIGEYLRAHGFGPAGESD